MADPISWIAMKIGEWITTMAFQAATALGASKSLASIIGAVAGFAGQGLVYVGAFALSSMLGPQLPSLESGQVPVNQSTPRRHMGVGRVKKSGPRALWEAIPGWNIEIINILDQPVDGFEKFYLNDEEVTLDADGWVQTQEGGRYGKNDIRILTRLGNHDDTAFAPIVDMFAARGLGDLYGPAHITKGAAQVAMMCKVVPDKWVMDSYPNGPPMLSVLTRLVKVYDWRDPDQSLMDPTTWKWSRNAVVCHVHFEWLLRHLPVKVDGAGWIQGDGRPPPPICLEAWTFDILPRLAEATAAADLADEDVNLKAGGSEKRYTLGGWWEIGTEDADIRGRMLSCYDGWMAEGADGALVIRGGKYEAPTFVLPDRNIVEASWNRHAPDRDTFNLLTGVFCSPEHLYTSQETQAWRDDVSIARLGEKPTKLDMSWVQSHGQARRLLKRNAVRVFAERHGDVAADLYGLDGLEERYIRIQRKRGPASMRDVICEVRASRIDLGALRVPFGLVKADPNVDAWNPLTEEGDGPSVTERAPPVYAPIPDILGIEPRLVASGDSVATVLRIVLADPDRPLLQYIIGWREQGSVSWFEGMPLDPDMVDGDLVIHSGFVLAGNLEVRVASYTGGSMSEWSDIVVVDTATATHGSLDFSGPLNSGLITFAG